MTYMAVEACTASLVVTGVVHADPHEGNVMLADDGRLVFLDFGLPFLRRRSLPWRFGIFVAVVVI